MSAPETTEQAAPDPLDTEARVRADEWTRQKDAALKRELHQTFGYADSAVARELEKADYARARLDLSDEAIHEAETLLGVAGSREVGARWGDALSSLPPNLTPEQAHEESRDIMTDADFLRRHAAGDARARRYWEALTTLAARRR